MRKNKEKSGFVKGAFVVFVIALITIFIAQCMTKIANNTNPSENIFHMEITKKEESTSHQFSKIDISSSNATLIVLGKKQNTVLFDKSGDKKIYPASMTKIMTAIVALENIEDLNTKIVLNKEMFKLIRQFSLSVAGFLPGEKVRAIDLLYGLMLPSGAECAIGLSQYVSGSENKFVDLMNKKAQQLNMNNTHFKNVSGLHNENHYSTATDIAKLMEYAIKNNTFYKIFTSEKYSTNPTNIHNDGITFYSTFLSHIDKEQLGNGIVLGGKTGYTSEAGQCLASLCEKNGKRFILVTAGAQGNNQTQQLHIDDAIKIYNQLFKYE